MQIVIIGGGKSIKEGIRKGLKSKLINRFTLGTNYSYKYFPSTALCFVDAEFYNNEKNNLKDLLLIGSSAGGQVRQGKNRLLLKINATRYTRDLSEGVYKGLSGIFALSVAIYLLDNFNPSKKEIFLLGMDWGNVIMKGDKVVKGKSVADDRVEKINPRFVYCNKYRILTHFYDDIIHRGSGKIDYYTSHSPRAIFRFYDNIKDIKIWNVSLLSHIPNFEKISYEEFFDRLEPVNYDQSYLRERIKTYVKHSQAYTSFNG